jgi:anti-anti-sigma regulatory factor
MLKITVHEDQRMHTIKLDGRIGGPWVEELERTSAALAASLGSKKLLLDLRDVTFADGNGRKLLREIYQETHAAFLTDSPLTKYFADEAMQPRKRELEGE